MTDLARLVSAHGRRISAADGTRLFAPGDEGQAYLVPLSGSVRVEQTALSGRVVVLYRLGPGEGCVMTTTCLLTGRPYGAWGYAEGALEAVAIPAEAFHRLLDSDQSFRAAVMSAFSSRMPMRTTYLRGIALPVFTRLTTMDAR
ncbi:Crp/Fnr family transcriptional regulator [Jannaschia aquimarina]|uniref:Cyclic nucleotide-binding domain protein n=1 Tax=Jannaschia aquimarina TaxID=935700 RepID=A0A0D1ER57_9RHOB|nr:Cyclic nucleotide-binding domain protein [Jannaschia aquimarina]SNT41011.1 CRP/FNR family transcriptional regulator, anaerobic regulatory protein [Jannaschia aquimarina]